MNDIKKYSKKPGLKDIAEYVGVSTALVSYVLNGQALEKRVNKKTAEKIIVAAKRIRYQPNHIAKSLKIQKTNTIGLLVADINYRYTAGVTRAIELEAKKKNYAVIYGSSNESIINFRELLDVFINRRVDGLIIVPVENSQESIKLLKKAKIPFILIDRYFPEIKTNYIIIDNYMAVYKSTEYLINAKKKRIAFINIKTSLFHLKERNRGYLSALKDYGINFEPKWLQEVDNLNLIEDIQMAIDRILALPDPCDTIFFATDTLAIEGLKYLNIKKINVPDELAVLSFDESEAFGLFYCPITHYRQPLEEIGKKAVNILIQLMNHDKINLQMCLEGDFIIEKSCGEK